MKSADNVQSSVNIYHEMSDLYVFLVGFCFYWFRTNPFTNTARDPRTPNLYALNHFDWNARSHHALFVIRSYVVASGVSRVDACVLTLCIAAAAETAVPLANWIKTYIAVEHTRKLFIASVRVTSIVKRIRAPFDWSTTTCAVRSHVCLCSATQEMIRMRGPLCCAHAI